MGRQATPTPDEPLAAGQEGTPPPAEPAAPPAPATTPDQPAAEPDLNLAQAEYTRSQQTIAAIRAELGLDKKATREQVMEALRTRVSGEPADDEGEPPDPRIAAAEERAFSAELRVQAAIYTPIYGSEFASKALEAVNVVRQTNDPEEIFAAMSAFVDAYRAPVAPVDAPAAGAPATPPADTGLPEGDQAPSARPVPSAGRRESGTVGAVREIFAGLGIGAPAPKS
jgi:hypothetical protein